MWTNKPCSVSSMQKRACLSFKFKKQHTSGTAAILSKLKLCCIRRPQSYKQDELCFSVFPRGQEDPKDHSFCSRALVVVCCQFAPNVFFVTLK